MQMIKYVFSSRLEALESTAMIIIDRYHDWVKSRKALYDVMNNLQANMDADDFKNFAMNLRGIWEPKSILAEIFDWILVLLLGISM